MATFNKHDISRNQCQLFGAQAENIGCEWGEYLIADIAFTDYKPLL